LQTIISKYKNYSSYEQVLFLIVFVIRLSCRCNWKKFVCWVLYEIIFLDVISGNTVLVLELLNNFRKSLTIIYFHTQSKLI